MSLRKIISKTMATNTLRLRTPVHLVLDFDATITVRDTIVLLREIPLQRNKRLGYEAYDVPEWSTLEDAYMKDYEGHKKTETAARRSIADQSRPFISRARGYSEMLVGRKTLEERSMKRLEGWELFRGVTRADVCKVADAVVRDGRLKMRDRWAEVIHIFSQNNTGPEISQKSKVSIISLNWSKTFIRQCLLSALNNQRGDDSEFTRFIDQDLQIHSCEIMDLDKPEGSSGQMQADVLSSADKLRYLPAASRKRPRLYPNRRTSATSPYLVYIGDSATDFDCLMAADTGVWLCPADSMKEASEKCNQCFKPLTLRLRPIRDIGPRDIGEDELVWAQNFEQITAFLSNLAP